MVVRTECPEEIIIIGAGIAGLAAAHEFALNSCNFTIIEAGPRLGGRALSVPLGNETADIGVAFV